MSADYYKTLGVDKKSSGDEIKKAFRKLAMQYHPDRNSGDATSEEKFKEVNEAYAVLSDEGKRQQYDMYGADGFRARYSQDDIFSSFDFSRIFDELGMRGGRFSGADLGGFFQGGRGPGFNPFGGQRSGPPRKGQNIEQDLTIGFHEAFNGGERTLQIQSPTGRENIGVKIPKGITPGKKLRVRGKGHPSPSGGEQGDLFLKILVAEHPLYRLRDYNIEMELPLPLTTVVLGGSAVVDLPSGDERNLKISPLTPTGTRLRIRGEGFPQPNGAAGDLIVKLTLAVPSELTDDQREHFEALKASGL
jgi:curved DNA-binding protein